MCILVYSISLLLLVSQLLRFGVTICFLFSFVLTNCNSCILDKVNFSKCAIYFSMHNLFSTSTFMKQHLSVSIVSIFKLLTVTFYLPSEQIAS